MLIIKINIHIILPPSEIPGRLFLAVLQAQKGNTYFTELAERVEYDNYVLADADELGPFLQALFVFN